MAARQTQRRSRDRRCSDEGQGPVQPRGRRVVQAPARACPARGAERAAGGPPPRPRKWERSRSPWAWVKTIRSIGWPMFRAAARMRLALPGEHCVDEVSPSAPTKSLRRVPEHVERLCAHAEKRARSAVSTFGQKATARSSSCSVWPLSSRSGSSRSLCRVDPPRMRSTFIRACRASPAAC